MSDFGNIYGSFEEAEKALERKDYLYAAEQYWWTIQYYEYGEFPIYDAYLVEMEGIACSKLNMIINNHLSMAKLSKSTFVMGRQCVKQLWMHKYKYNERVVSDQLQGAFDRGHTIGKLAQHLLPNGKDASEDMFEMIKRKNLQAKTPFRINNMPFILKQNKWIKSTCRLIETKEKYIYEAAFAHNDVFAAIDILERIEDGYIAYEVKSTDSVREVYLSDASLQYYVINAHIPLKEFYIVYLNKDYVEELNIPLKELSEENCDLHKLFLKKSILNEILTQQAEIEHDLVIFQRVVSTKSDCPKIAMGDQCNNPYECVFKQYCSKQK